MKHGLRPSSGGTLFRLTFHPPLPSVLRSTDGADQRMSARRNPSLNRRTNMRYNLAMRYILLFAALWTVGGCSQNSDDEAPQTKPIPTPSG